MYTEVLERMEDKTGFQIHTHLPVLKVRQKRTEAIPVSTPTDTSNGSLRH